MHRILTLALLLFLPRTLSAGSSTQGLSPLPVSFTATAKTLQGEQFGFTTGVRTKTGAAEEALVYFVNSSTGAKNILLSRQLFVSVDSGVTLIFRLYTLPVVTSSGTALDITNFFLGGPSNPTTVASAYFQPTVTSNGTLIAVYEAVGNPYNDEIASQIALAPGRRLLMTVESSGNNKRWSYNLSWIEEPI